MIQFRILLLIGTWVAACAHADGSIYRCEINGVATFSDRPCGAGSTSHTPDATRVSIYEAPPAAPSRATHTPPTKRVARTSVAEAQSKAAEECRRIEAALRDLRSKQRAGYSAREGERLKERQRTLNERRRIKRCR